MSEPTGPGVPRVVAGTIIFGLLVLLQAVACIAIPGLIGAALGHRLAGFVVGLLLMCALVGYRGPAFVRVQPHQERLFRRLIGRP